MGTVCRSRLSCGKRREMSGLFELTAVNFDSLSLCGLPIIGVKISLTLYSLRKSIESGVLATLFERRARRNRNYASYPWPRHSRFHTRRFQRYTI